MNFYICNQLNLFFYKYRVIILRRVQSKLFTCNLYSPQFAIYLLKSNLGGKARPKTTINNRRD